jgi:hypothetical protein
MEQPPLGPFKTAEPADWPAAGSNLRSMPPTGIHTLDVRPSVQSKKSLIEPLIRWLAMSNPSAPPAPSAMPLRSFD